MAQAKDDLHKKQLTRFHSLCARAGIKEHEKKALVESYGVDSSADIPRTDLIDLCNRLNEAIAGRKIAQTDKMRKMVIASIGGFLRATGQPDHITRIKGIACQASGYDDFNKIPSERLRNIYNTFRNKQKDIVAVSDITDKMLTPVFITNDLLKLLICLA